MANKGLDNMYGQCSSFIWEITGFRQKLRSLKLKALSCLESETFRTTEFGLKVKVRLALDTSGKYIDIYLDWDKGSQIYWHAREFTMVDQSDRFQKEHVTITDTPLFSTNQADQMMKPFFVFSTLAPTCLLQKDYPYLKDDSILIKVCIKPLSLLHRSVASSNGILVWRVQNYSKKKQDEVKGLQRCLISDAFCHDPRGYRLHAVLYLDGCGQAKGKFISFFVCYIAGEFDHELPCPIDTVVRLSLLNQSDSPHRSDVISQSEWIYNEGSKYHGLEKFVLQSKAEEENFLQNDTLVFEILVEVGWWKVQPYKL